MIYCSTLHGITGYDKLLCCYLVAMTAKDFDSRKRYIRKRVRHMALHSQICSCNSSQQKTKINDKFNNFN